MVESITVDPDTEEAVALASRMRVRNAAVNEHLSDPQSLPPAPSSPSTQRQLLTDVLKQPLDDHQRTLPRHATAGE